MQISAVIFDMDGLMLDTEPLYKLAWQRAAVECGYLISDEQYFELIGRSRADAERVLAEAFGPGFPLQPFRTECLKYEAAVFTERLPSKKPGLDGLLEFLETRNLPMAVATSTDRERAGAQLGGLGLLARFNVLATGDEVVNGKPAPDLFLLAAQRLGVEPSGCLVLEDSEAGVTAAHRAGMLVYLVPDIRMPSAAVEKLTNGRFDSLAGVERQLRRQAAEKGNSAADARR